MSSFVACEIVTCVATISQLGGDTRETRNLFIFIIITIFFLIYFFCNPFFFLSINVYIYIFFFPSQVDILNSVIQFIINL